MRPDEGGYQDLKESVDRAEWRERETSNKDLRNRMVRVVENQEQSNLRIFGEMAGLLGAEGTVKDGRVRGGLGRVHSLIPSTPRVRRLVTNSYNSRQPTSTLLKCRSLVSKLHVQLSQECWPRMAGPGRWGHMSARSATSDEFLPETGPSLSPVLTYTSIDSRLGTRKIRRPAFQRKDPASLQDKQAAIFSREGRGIDFRYRGSSCPGRFNEPQAMDLGWNPPSSLMGGGTLELGTPNTSHDTPDIQRDVGAYRARKILSFPCRIAGIGTSR